MTKDYLKFPHGNKSYLPKMGGRRFPSRANFAAYKSDGKDPKDPKDPADPDTRKEDELLGIIDKRMADSLKGFATEAELNAIRESIPENFKGFPIEALREMADKDNGVMAILARQGLEISRLKAGISENQPQDMTIKGQIKRWLASPNEEGGTVTVAETVRDIKLKKRSDLKPLEIELNFRVNSPMTPANTYGGSSYLPKPEILPGLVDLIRPTYTFWNYIKKGATSSALLVWVNKKNPLGAAAFIAPGVYKPGISFTVNTQTSNAKKIAANEKVAVELLDDIDGLATWVEDELLYQVFFKASTTLMTGVLDTETPAGIQTLSVVNAFAALGLNTTNANIWDVCRAAVAQFRAGNFVGYNVTIFLNPIDMANAVMTKAQNQGQTFIPPATGAILVEDNNIPQGYFQAALLDLYKISVYKSFTMQWGLENDDFTKNLRTVIGEMRIHQYFSENHVGAFIYDTIDNGIAALTPGP